MSTETTPVSSPPDQPELPQVAPGVGRFLARTLTAVVIAVYLILSFTGWSEVSGDDGRGNVPASVRNSPGGFRTYHFWHSGYMGGK